MYERMPNSALGWSRNARLIPSLSPRTQRGSSFLGSCRTTIAASRIPHPTFYKMASYKRQMSSLRNGMTADMTSTSYDPNADMAAHSSRHKCPTAEPEMHLSREQLQELRQVQTNALMLDKRSFSEWISRV
ncbi:hypothetical protein RSAG8_05880, partial [Rhizoctonia solani AG-8 WAC10335]